MEVNRNARRIDESQPNPEQSAANDTTRDASQPASETPFFPDQDAIRIALENGRVGVWSWEVASNRLSWSSNLEDIHGLPRGTFDGTFSVFENDIHPEDRPAVMASIQEVLSTHKPRQIQYRLPPRPGRGDRWIESSATVVVEHGTAVRMVGICRDITYRVTLHHELRVRALQQEAVARLGERALVENDLLKFFGEAVTTVAEILGVELVKILELVPGDAELVLRAGVGWKPGLVGTALVSTCRESHAGYTLASGSPVVTDDLAAETRFHPQPLLLDHGAVSGVSAPIAGHDGRAYGVLTAHSTKKRKFSETDVSFLVSVGNVVAGAIQRVQLDRRQELMIRELRHRSGNLFSQLLAMFSQTAKNSKNLAELTTKYEARVLALANAHRLVTEGGWKSASLMEVINTLLAPHIDRISLAGANVYLEPDPTFGISMALHELATNATKFGSLSVRPGRVEVTWLVERTDRGLTLVLDWKEREGPAPKRTRRAGFGSRLINMVIKRQLNGAVDLDYTNEGLNARLVVPLTYERWPGASQ